jgi:hypothetical protein
MVAAAAAVATVAEATLCRSAQAQAPPPCWCSAPLSCCRFPDPTTTMLATAAVRMAQASLCPRPSTASQR